MMNVRLGNTTHGGRTAACVELTAATWKMRAGWWWRGWDHTLPVLNAARFPALGGWSIRAWRFQVDKVSVSSQYGDR